MKQLERGITLVELLVTVAIVGILASFAAPSFQSMVETRRLIAATEGVYAHLQFARSEAVKFGRGNDEKLNFSIKTGTPWCLGISNDTASCDCNTAAVCAYGPAAVMERNLSGNEFANVTMATNQANAQIDSIRGGFGGTAGTITLTSPSSLTTKVIFSRLGRVKICSDSNVSGYPSCPSP